jgi:predicted SnoaL-like aldol condensation-catalyzing enzyme
VKLSSFTVPVFVMAALMAPIAAQAGTRQEENKKTVVEFYEQAINRKNFNTASKFLGPRYVQHNQRAADGADGLKDFILVLREKYPNAHSEIKRVFAEGEFVVLHVHAVREPGTRGMAIVDIFRMKNGRIVEHWDVHEDIIENPANANGMF